MKFRQISIQKGNDDIIDTMIKQLGGVFKTAQYIRLVLDDSPTKRYGRRIEGAGYHHNPTPGRTKSKTCFGHSWVVVVPVIGHPFFGEIYFPISAADVRVKKTGSSQIKVNGTQATGRRKKSVARSPCVGKWKNCCQWTVAYGIFCFWVLATYRKSTAYCRRSKQC
jgi:hypothetical protein